MINKHTSLRRWTLNLIASENIMSSDVSHYYNLALGHRYGNYEGLDVKNRKYRGNYYIAEMEARAISDACQMFHAETADFRPLSGHIAGCAIVLGLCKPNDLVLELDKAAGGHCLAEKLSNSNIISLRVEPVPFDEKKYQVNIGATLDKISKMKPRIVILGSSNYLFPTPLEEIAAICRSCGSVLILDASHILGLIAGGVFPQPFDFKVDIVVSSTHKTFAGPQGGLILSNSSENYKNVLPALYPGLITNHHLMRIPALIALFAEWKKHGRRYAKAIIKNAIRLAEELENVGIPVINTPQGPTQSHTLLIKNKFINKRAKELSIHLERCGIMVSEVKLPDIHGGEGLRVGLQEVTRLGLKTSQISELAKIIKDAIFSTKPEVIQNHVKGFTQYLQKIHFCDSHE